MKPVNTGEVEIFRDCPLSGIIRSVVFEFKKNGYDYMRPINFFLLLLS
jgi:hypothetical protein